MLRQPTNRKIAHAQTFLSRCRLTSIAQRTTCPECTTTSNRTNVTHSHIITGNKRTAALITYSSAVLFPIRQPACAFCKCRLVGCRRRLGTPRFLLEWVIHLAAIGCVHISHLTAASASSAHHTRLARSADIKFDAQLKIACTNATSSI